MKKTEAKKMGTRAGKPPAKAPAALAPKPKPKPAPEGGPSDAELRKMTAAILEKLKSPKHPPSVVILEALQQVRDKTLAMKGK